MASGVDLRWDCLLCMGDFIIHSHSHTHPHTLAIEVDLLNGNHTRLKKKLIILQSRPQFEVVYYTWCNRFVLHSFPDNCKFIPSEDEHENYACFFEPLKLISVTVYMSSDMLAIVFLPAENRSSTINMSSRFYPTQQLNLEVYACMWWSKGA